MKRKCNHVDITDLNFIKKAVMGCMNKKVEKVGRKIYQRNDVKIYFTEHNSNIDSIASELQREIINRKLVLEPVRHSQRIDSSNGKLRELNIEHIKQQFYGYLAYNALEELQPYVGVNQIACVEGKGQQYGARLVYGWIQNPDIRYCIKADLKKCYPSITHQNMMKWLRRHVKNDTLLWLIEELLNTWDEGLAIGSILSIRLCSLYVADLYHHLESSYIYEKRGKRVNPVKHIMIYLDDIFIFGSNAKQLHKVIKGTIAFAAERGLTIKPNWQLINLNPDDINVHIDVIGYKVYRSRITARHKNYSNLKKSLKRYKKNPNIHTARSLVARSGMFINHTDSDKFCKKYNLYLYRRKAKRIVSRYDKSKICMQTATS